MALGILLVAYPVLPHWATVFRASGAGLQFTRENSQPLVVDRNPQTTLERFQIDYKKAEAPEARQNVAQPVRAGTGGKGTLSTVGATLICYEF
jgi:hypothetical protein